MSDGIFYLLLVEVNVVRVQNSATVSNCRPVQRGEAYSMMGREEWLCIIEPCALMRACSWEKSSGLECFSFQPPFGGWNGYV
ncbi:hypothetical protein TNCV_4684291 [Trichonephila clavipes]|nr:hypothetical protein TNCV_4684291 [Trichonephila clavipes]